MQCRSLVSAVYGQSHRPAWPDVWAYLDDIIVASETFEEHLKRVEEVIKRVQSFGLTINRENSEFCCSEVKYLGFVLNAEGLKTDPDKVQAINDYPPPPN